MPRPTFYPLPATFSRLTRKRWLLAAAFVLFAILFAPRAFADTGTIAAEFIGWVVQQYISVVGGLLLALINILIRVAQYNDFINSEAVKNGWVIVRDLANMFFVLILLVIAFATIFGVQEYSYKKLLPKLLIIAVLINFSRVIAGLAIDFGQVVMLTFVNGFKEAAGGNFVSALGIAEIMAISTNKTAIVQADVIGSYLLAGLLISVATVAILVMLAALIYRMVMLWVYIVLSPIAFLMGTFPQGQKYYAQWWEQFTNLIIVGPVLAFFLWLSLLSVQTSGTSGGNIAGDWPESRTASGETAEVNVGITEAGKEPSMTRFIISLGLLLGGLMVSQQVAGAAAPGMGSFMGKIQKGATGAFKGTGLAALRGMKRVSGVEALQKSYRAQRERAQEVGLAGAMGGLGKRMGAGVTVATTFGSAGARAQRRQVYEDELAKKKGTISHLTNDQVAEQAKKGKPEAARLLAERGALTPEFMAAKGLDYATMQKSFGPAAASQQEFEKSLRKSNPSAAYNNFATADDRTQFAQALKKGETSLDNVAAGDLNNAALVQSIQSTNGWTESQWESQLNKLNSDQQSNLLEGMKTHTSAVDLNTVPPADVRKELSMKRFVAKGTPSIKGDLAAARLGDYDYVDPVDKQRRQGNALQDFARAEGERMATYVAPESLEDPDVVRDIQLAMPPAAYENFLKNLTPALRDAFKNGSAKLVTDAPKMAALATPEDRQKVREHAMAAGAGAEASYGYKTGLAVPGAATADFAASLKGTGAPKVLLNLSVGDIQADIEDALVDNLDPAQFMIAAREAMKTGRADQLATMRAIMAAVSKGTSANAKALQAQLKQKVFKDIAP